MGIKFNPFTSNFDFSGESSVWLPVVQSETDLPNSDPDGAVRAVLDTDRVYVYDSATTTWTDSGITIGTFSASADAKGISTSLVTDGNIIRPTVTLHAANATNPGALSISAQDIAGNKTFKNNAIVEGQIKANTIDALVTGNTIGIGIADADVINIGHSGATVNIMGTTNTINVTNLDVTDKNITVNDGGSAGSGSDAGIEVEEAGSIAAYVKTSADRNSWRIKAPNATGEVFVAPNNDGFSQVINSQTLTSNRTLTIPNITGIAVVTEGNQTINGNKTLSGTTDISGTAKLSTLTASKPLKLDSSKNIISQAIDVTADITGVTPVANGGTNSSAALSNNKVMVSTAGAIVESSVTSTELGNLSGSSSNIQTQLNALAAADLTFLKTDGSRSLTGNLLPNTTLTTDLGSATKAFNAIHATEIDSPPGNGLLISSDTGINIDATGNSINVTNSKITNLASPTAGTDAANKNFVLQPNTGDIKITSFTGSQSVAVPTDITGFAFANGSVRSFRAIVTIVVNATASLYQQLTVKGIQRGADWMISTDAVGDSTGVVLSITTAGQIQYISNTYAGFSGMTIKFKAEAMPI